MRVSRTIRGIIVTLSCAGLLIAQVGSAAAPAVKHVRDVALQSAGVLHGQVVDQQGQPQLGMAVAAVQNGKTVATSQTGQDGQFVMANLSGGVYELQTAASNGVYRLWAPRTAPPSAQDGVLLVNSNELARGQQGHALGFLANPWVLAGIVAAAIAIPLAVSAADNDEGS
jgi:hypothetical protein